MDTHETKTGHCIMYKWSYVTLNKTNFNLHSWK